MRLIGVWMVSVDQDHAFLNQHLLQLGIRSGYFTVVSRAPCARVVRCVARREGEHSSISDAFYQIIVEKSFVLLIKFMQHNTVYLLHNLPPD